MSFIGFCFCDYLFRTVIVCNQKANRPIAQGVSKFIIMLLKGKHFKFVKINMIKTETNLQTFHEKLKQIHRI